MKYRNVAAFTHMLYLVAKTGVRTREKELIGTFYDS